MSKVLGGLGLTKNEIKVYLSLVDLGSATAGEITEKAGMHRRNVYDNIERLAGKGLVGFTIKRKKKYFEANPEKLMHLIAKQEKVLEERKNLVEILIPKLIKQKGKKHQISIFEGEEGVKTIFEKILKDKKTNHCIGAYNYPYALEYYLEQWHQRRVKSKIMDKLLFKKSSLKRAKMLAKLPYTQARILPKKLTSPVAINVWKDNVAFILCLEKDFLGILINNKKVADDFKGYFDILWGIAYGLG